jgi:acyl dehydratase
MMGPECGPVKRGNATVFNDLSEFVAAAGSELGPTEWMQVTQDRVNLFAEATNHHQRIDVDPERAASGPFGGPSPRSPDPVATTAFHSSAVSRRQCHAGR